MQIVIDIEKKDYDRICGYSTEYIQNIFSEAEYRAVTAIRKGTPLPKVHGKLGDLDELVKNIVKEYGVNSIHELPQDIKMFYDKLINSAPTILDATFDYKLNNYAFFREEKEK